MRAWRPLPAADGLGFACAAVFEGHTAAVTSLLAAGDGRTLFSGCAKRSTQPGISPMPATRSSAEFSASRSPSEPRCSISSTLNPSACLFFLLCLTRLSVVRVRCSSWDQSVRVWDYWTEAAPAVGAAESDSSQSQPQMRHSLTAVLSTAGSEGAHPLTHPNPHSV